MELREVFIVHKYICGFTFHHCLKINWAIMISQNQYDVTIYHYYVICHQKTSFQTTSQVIWCVYECVYIAIYRIRDTSFKIHYNVLLHHQHIYPIIYSIVTVTITIFLVSGFLSTKNYSNHCCSNCLIITPTK